MDREGCVSPPAGAGALAAPMGLSNDAVCCGAWVRSWPTAAVALDRVHGSYRRYYGPNVVYPLYS